MLKTMGIILRVLAVILLIGFIVGGVFAGKFVTWFGSGALTGFDQIMSLAVNWIAAAAVWTVRFHYHIWPGHDSIAIWQAGRALNRASRAVCALLPLWWNWQTQRT